VAAVTPVIGAEVTGRGVLTVVKVIVVVIRSR
jgi:hypothetical protein